jgi:hypothetical protein
MHKVCILPHGAHYGGSGGSLAKELRSVAENKNPRSTRHGAHMPQFRACSEMGATADA